MGARAALQKIADRKSLEINSLQTKLAEARAYYQAIQDAIKALPREDAEPHEDYSLREGTAIAEARGVLASVGHPLHILEILKRMGRPTDKPNRVSLSGSLSAYVRKNQVFRKTAPNTFSLIASAGGNKNTPSESSEGFPAGFGDVIDSTERLPDTSPVQTESPSVPQSEQTGANSPTLARPMRTPNIGAIRESVAASLDSAGHQSAAQLIRSGIWSIDGDRFKIEIDMGRKMLALTVNTAAEKVIGQSLAKIGVPTLFSVVSSRNL